MPSGDPAPRRLVVASANPKKAAEISEVLTDVWPEGVEIVPRPAEIPEVLEDADSFVGNARLKAAAIAGATGEWSLADDSGLVVDALDGAPGVHSARYAGAAATDAENVALLLSELAGVGALRAPDRRARFVCAVVLRHPDGTETVAEGAVEGTIIDAGRGHGGFGYDPVFVPIEGDGRTFAQMSGPEKHAMSHRGRALRDLIAQLGR